MFFVIQLVKEVCLWIHLNSMEWSKIYDTSKYFHTLYVVPLQRILLVPCVLYWKLKQVGQVGDLGEVFCPFCFILTHPKYVMQLLLSSLLVLKSAARTLLKAGRGSLESVLVLSLLTLSLSIIYILFFFFLFKLYFPLLLSVLVTHPIFMPPLWRQPWREASGCQSVEAIIQKHSPRRKDGLVVFHWSKGNRDLMKHDFWP